jgi:hypothetical protein
MTRTPLAALAALTLSLASCQGASEPLTSSADRLAPAPALEDRGTGLRTLSFPADDPGGPFYTRVSTILNQIFHDGETLAIPVYRDPSCIPADFDLLQAFHFPGPEGPGAFACPLLVEGTLLIEPDAPLGTFPFQVITRGPAQVWFVSYPAFRAAAADGDFTMAELLALQPLRGQAEHFHEMLNPRMEDHRVVITSQGILEDGRRFQFNVNHPGDRTRTLQIRIQ